MLHVQALIITSQNEYCAKMRVVKLQMPLLFLDFMTAKYALSFSEVMELWTFENEWPLYFSRGGNSRFTSKSVLGTEGIDLMLRPREFCLVI